MRPFFHLYLIHSAQRSLQPYLDKYGLQAEVIPKSTFLGAAHDTGVCVCTTSISTSVTRHSTSSASAASDSMRLSSFSSTRTNRQKIEEEVEEVEKEIPTFADIFLIRITKR